MSNNLTFPARTLKINPNSFLSNPVQVPNPVNFISKRVYGSVTILTATALA